MPRPYPCWQIRRCNRPLNYHHNTYVSDIRQIDDEARSVKFWNYPEHLYDVGDDSTMHVGVLHETYSSDPAASLPETVPN